MTEKRLFYVSTEKKALENEDWVSFVDEVICENSPYEVKLVDEFYDSFDPEMIEGNEFFDIKKDGEFFELTLKKGAIEEALALYSNTLREYADYIDREKTRGINPTRIDKAGAYLKHQKVFTPFGGQRFMLIEEYNDSEWTDITSVETIYGLVDLAIMRGINKWYLYPQTGYYRFWF